MPDKLTQYTDIVHCLKSYRRKQNGYIAALNANRSSHIPSLVRGPGFVSMSPHLNRREA